MAIVKRYNENPILLPMTQNYWEAEATFNGCPIKEDKKIHLFYRALSAKKHHLGAQMNVSSIGYAVSTHLDDFKERRQIVEPSEDWDQYGCEDPRVTKIGKKYFIFYTALSKYPFEASGIKVGLAITSNFKKVEKHQVTTFNSKAMAMFPEKINGKYAVIVTADTDNPPAKIAVAYFDKIEDIWSKRYWNNWYKKVNEHKIDFHCRDIDHIEIGSAPIKVKEGWLLIYSHIKRYFNPGDRTFEIRAVLLDHKNPQKIIAQGKEALFVPEETYELYGKVPNIVFPSGTYIDGKELHIYYGAADTVCCGVKLKLQKVIDELLETPEERAVLKRFDKNPIITPNPQNAWEAMSTYNAGAIRLKGKTYIYYRAQSKAGKSVLGCAITEDGYNITERLTEPVYVPRANFEDRADSGWCGCEDPRLTQIGNKIYMFYTAYDGYNPASVALTTINVSDFIKRKWEKWEMPRLISPLKEFNKNACIFPEKINGKYIILHRINKSIDFHRSDDLNFTHCELCQENNWIIPRRGKWDDLKIGIAGPPVKTKYGWILIYHGVKKDDGSYRLGAALLDLNDPENIIYRSDKPILEPITEYEREGLVRKVTFSCATILDGNTIFVYYGGADSVVGVASITVEKLIAKLKESVY